MKRWLRDPDSLLIIAKFLQSVSFREFFQAGSVQWLLIESLWIIVSALDVDIHGVSNIIHTFLMFCLEKKCQSGWIYSSYKKQIIRSCQTVCPSRRIRIWANFTERFIASKCLHSYHYLRIESTSKSKGCTFQHFSVRMSVYSSWVIYKLWKVRYSGGFLFLRYLENRDYSPSCNML